MKSQSGNALFLILIAVALFAALSYAVTNSGRGGSGINKEQAEISAAQILQYASSLEQAILRMKLISGCSDREISFHYDSNGDNTLDNTDDYYNPNSVSKLECYVFHPQGAGISFQSPPQSFFSITGLPKWGEMYAFTGEDCVPDVGTGTGSICYNNGTNEDTELNMVMVGISDEICQSINRQVSGSSDIPTMFETWGNFYEYSFASGSFQGLYGDEPATTSNHITTIETTNHGQTTFCFYDQTPSANVFYHVLIAR